MNATLGASGCRCPYFDPQADDAPSNLPIDLKLLARQLPGLRGFEAYPSYLFENLLTLPNTNEIVALDW